MVGVFLCSGLVSPEAPRRSCWPYKNLFRIPLLWRLTLLHQYPGSTQLGCRLFHVKSCRTLGVRASSVNKDKQGRAALSSYTRLPCSLDSVAVCLCGFRILGPSLLPSYLDVICVALSRVCWVLTVRTTRLKSSRRFLLHGSIVPTPVLDIVTQLWEHRLHVLLCHSLLLSKEFRWRNAESSSTMEDIYYTSML